MRTPRTQQRLDDLFEWFFRVLFSVILIVCLIGLCKQCRDIEELQKQIGSTRVTVVAPEVFLPEGFDAQSAGYQAALQRYEIEQGHIFQDKKEAAPESANSGAVDTEKTAS